MSHPINPQENLRKETPGLDFPNDNNKVKWLIGVGVTIIIAIVVAGFVFLQTKEQPSKQTVDVKEQSLEQAVNVKKQTPEQATNVKKQSLEQAVNVKKQTPEQATNVKKQTPEQTADGKEQSPEQNVDGEEHLPKSQDSAYGGPFYRKDDKVFAGNPKNSLIDNLEFPDADPDSFIFLHRLSAYDKDNFHYLKRDLETNSYLPTSFPLIPEIKQLFNLIEVPGEDIKIVWNSNTEVSFENVTYRKLSEYGDFQTLSIEIYEILNNGTIIGYLWTNGLKKTNVANNKLYFYTDSIWTGYKVGVYEVAYGNQPEMIIDIDHEKTTFKPGGSKIYYTKSYDALDFYEYDTVTRKERKIPVQYKGITTSSSSITLSPDEKHLLVQSREGHRITSKLLVNSVLLVDINTGKIEIVRYKETTNREVIPQGGDFPFAVSPSSDKVFFIKIPYEGYLFANPTYVQKDATTGVWSSELNISSINLEVGGGWNIDTGQWSISPSGRYLAVADATENSIYSCGGMGGPRRAHNIIKIFDLETLKTQTLVVKNPDEDFVLNSWRSDESGIFATKRKVELEENQDCGDPSREGSQEFYSR